MVVRFPLLYWQHMAYYLVYRSWLLRVHLSLRKDPGDHGLWIGSIETIKTMGCLKSDLKHLLYEVAMNPWRWVTECWGPNVSCLPVFGFMASSWWWHFWKPWGQDSWSRSLGTGLPWGLYLLLAPAQDLSFLVCCNVSSKHVVTAIDEDFHDLPAMLGCALWNNAPQ